MSRQSACLADVAARLDGMASELSRVREAIEEHETWHRDTMHADVQAARSRRIAVLAVIVSAVSAAAGVAGWFTVLAHG